MQNKNKTKWILIILVCGSCSLLQNCRHDNLASVNNSKVKSMLKKLPSQYERGNISAKDGRLLYDMIFERGYSHGLEIGTSNGYSALWQGLAYKQTNGKLLTIEIDSIAANEAQVNFVNAGLQDVIDLKIDDAKNVLGSINENFDFVFVDTGDSGLDFFDLTYPVVISGGTIVIHNINKKDPKLKAILKNPDLNARIKSRLFYRILICTKKNYQG